MSLAQRTDPALPGRLARSAAAADGAQLRTADFDDWLAERINANKYQIDRVPFTDLDGWSFDPGTGNLGHRSGRFFTIEGMRVTVDPLSEVEPPFRHWHQPVINQPEIGCLGILAREFDGVLHLLMQAKMEPGNSNLVQLSPTVQATRSNYTRVHQGAPVRYLEYFLGPRRGTVLADVLQSEHGSWFYRKSNRNMLVEVTEEVPRHEDYCWLTLGQIGRLLHRDNVINMDSRTVLSCIPFADPHPAALLPDTALRSWFTGERARWDVHAELLPLDQIPDWTRDDFSVHRPDGRYFEVLGVSVHAGNREVTNWTQPLLEPTGLGVAAFLTREIGGVPHVLAHARVEGGFLDVVELGPTVQYTPRNYAQPTGADRPPFLDEVLAAHPARIRYEAVHSEEGGRFLNAESRYMVIDAPDAPLEPPPCYQWVTPGQLTALVRHGHYVNVQGRTLLAALNAMEAAR